MTAAPAPFKEGDEVMTIWSAETRKSRYVVTKVTETRGCSSGYLVTTSPLNGGPRLIPMDSDWFVKSAGAADATPGPPIGSDGTQPRIRLVSVPRPTLVASIASKLEPPSALWTFIACPPL